MGRTSTGSAPARPAAGSASGRRRPRAKSPAGPPAGAVGKKLVIVESPAKARTINRYLGRDYVVKASMGHVRDLPQRQMGVDVEKGFAPTYEVLAGRKKVVAELRRYARSAPEVFLATDLDREGEAIAWHLAKCLDVPDEHLRRVIFNEITAPAIRQAFANPRMIDMDKVNAQQARRILDRIVGYELSPLLWRKVSPGLSAGRVQSVAVRLIVDREREIEAFIPEEYWKIEAVFTTQTASAAALAQQWQTFLAQPDPSGNPPTRHDQMQFLRDRHAFRSELARWQAERFKTDKGDAAIDAAKALGLAVMDVRRMEDPAGKGPAQQRVAVTGTIGPHVPAYQVTDLAPRESRTRPPAPFTTAALQQTASIQLRFAASRTMRIAQQLYEGVSIPGEGQVGLITYMRTDSRHLSSVAVNQVRSLIAERFGGKYIPEKPNFYSSSQRAQEAHEAIRPTDAAIDPEQVREALTPDQYQLYKLIWTRFVACQMAPAVWTVTEASIAADTPAGQAVFIAIGRNLVFDGFYRVAGMPKAEEQVLPDLAAGQVVSPIQIDPTQHFTQPPPRYTEASLVKALEAEGIGRPSTYASIIQTIQDRQYVRLMDRAFVPTDLGKVVTDKLVKHFPEIFDVRFTANMEDRLDQIEDRREEWGKVLESFYGPFRQNLDRAKEEMVHARAESQPSEYTCDACGKPMVYRFSKTGRFLACTGYPECRTTAPVDDSGKKVIRVEVPTPCPQCGKNMILRRSRFGPFLGCADYPKCKGTLPCDANGNPLKVVKEEDIKETCSACGSPMAVRRKGRRAFLGCSRYPECRNVGPLPEGIRLAQPPKAEPKPAGVNCPKCGRAMVIRAGRRGEFLACSGYPKCRKAADLSQLEAIRAQQQAAPSPPPTAPAPSRKRKPS